MSPCMRSATRRRSSCWLSEPLLLQAQAQLRQVSTVDPRMRGGSKVVPVFQLKVNGMAFRLIPEQSEVKNALQVREKSGSTANSFPVVPVFQ
nr:protein TIC 22-like, chloroplastic isoform X2 [Arachis hypogaea]